ncbi:meiosis-specific protein SPO11 [Kluyveromyces marxianus]|uniref:DNA topoisomerase (ATP-hydrolyzing) n=2 Tax=Kluyveromyces marxianus TaxID=4911 RepID=W0TCD2_KLUMD|nr:meiosis-specific protein SPO11 [Kluyveromyces marxianus DMKU3-1042]QGN16787.1 meiosis-specific protein SPO11 [Kluyveromyces marxianus]BAO41070.1 meiosis-specific protein SPO11 [Kluyveromyces marxianus DMKU3-1042]
MDCSLRTLMDGCHSRAELKQRMLPRSRVVEFSKIKSEEECQRQITNNMRFMRLALKEHGIPIEIRFHNSRNNEVSWKYPEFGSNWKKCSKVPQLLQLLSIVNERLKLKKTSTTVRDIYYGNVELFGNQSTVEQLLQRLESMFQVEKQFFNIVSTQKGLLFAGPKLSIEGQIFHQECQLVPYMNKEEVPISIGAGESCAKVVVLEKDAIFQQLIQCKNLVQNWIVITGKGYPDLLTRQLLHHMGQKLPQEVEFLIYTDSDPYGIDIVTKYMSHATLRNVQCSRIKHKGVLLSQLIARNRPGTHQMLVLLPLSLRDSTFAMNLIRRMMCQDTQIEEKTKRSLRDELQKQLFFQRKGEMNVVNNGDLEQYFSEEALRNTT